MSFSYSFLICTQGNVASHSQERFRQPFWIEPLSGRVLVHTTQLAASSQSTILQVYIKNSIIHYSKGLHSPEDSYLDMWSAHFMSVHPFIHLTICLLFADSSRITFILVLKQYLHQDQMVLLFITGKYSVFFICP